MLAPEQRMRDSDTFRRTVRAGRRAGSDALVVHVQREPASTHPQVGFVVGRGVGGAVVRNRVKRRLRHLLRGELPALVAQAGPVSVVVRALPPSAAMSSAELAGELDRCLRRVLRSQTQAGVAS